VVSVVPIERARRPWLTPKKSRQKVRHSFVPIGTPQNALPDRTYNRNRSHNCRFLLLPPRLPPLKCLSRPTLYTQELLQTDPVKLSLTTVGRRCLREKKLYVHRESRHALEFKRSVLPGSTHWIEENAASVNDVEVSKGRR